MKKRIKNIVRSVLAILIWLPMALSAQTTTENYVVKKVFKTKRTTVNGLSSIPSDSVTKIVSYFDGLGRAKQSIAVKAGGNKEDIITYFEYDAFGRQTKNYLPYAIISNNGDFRTGNQATITNQYYLDNYATDFAGITLPSNVNAFSDKTIENSPLNRVLEQAAPGKDWKLGTTFSLKGYSNNSHTIKFEYDINSSTDAVKSYSVTTANNTYTPSLVDNATYSVGQLSKTITKDENWTSGTNHTTEEFKNKQGQVVLKRTYANVSSVSTKHDTYYVYDDFGNLTYVLPPKINTGNTVTTAILNDLGYQYVYDNRNRLVEKRIPGKGKEYIVYDKLDRPVLTQDVNQRVPATNEWLFTKYDKLGRVVYTGIYDSNSTRTSLQNTFDAKTITQNYEAKVTSGTGYDNTYYTNDNFPNTSIEVLTVNYYDTYFFNLAGVGTQAAIGTVYGETLTTNAKGLATSSKVKVLDTSSWITTVSYYDDKARPIYIYSKNDYLGTTDIIESKLDDLTGKILETRSTHKKTGKTDIVTIDTFTYDHADRLLNQNQCIGDNTLVSCNDPNNTTNGTFSGVLNLQTPQTIVDNNSITLLPGFHAVPTSGQSAVFSIAPGNAELIVSNTYDALGQLKNKKVGNTIASPLQSVDYAYNVRGWLKNINQDTNTDNDLFNFSLVYNDIADASKKLFNGNISQTSWNTLNTDTSTKTYTYAYDALNRITSGIDNTANYNLDLVKYDKNGNITNLQRKGHTNVGATTFGLMDDLSYSYDNGNKLTKVLDNGDDTYGFKDGVDITTEYTYDLNGNMLTDANKGITGITYNHLNLPKVVTINGNTITYTYDAAGTKLRKIVSGTTTDYAGNYIYENTTLQFFNHGEGYVKNNSGTFSYVYQYKDHLGNIRLSYADADNSGSINAATEIVEESNYYPFGLKHKGYNNVVNGVENNFHTYNGKEHEKSLGLNWHDYGARRYDASLGRWMSTDPYAEKYETLSPYTYVANNPVNAIDPDGRLIIYVNGLLFDQALAHKSSGILGKGGFSSHYAYPPPRNFQRNGVTMFGQSVPYWGGDNGTRSIINNHFGDNNNIFINATDNFKSQASDRYAQGKISGLELIAQLQNGTIELENEETIKVVGHSQGAAFAAGMLAALADSEYASRVELGLYLSPHQPGGFEHPDGIFGAQLSTRTDKVSSKGGLLGKLMQAFNGQSELSEIQGVDFLFIRPSNDSSLGGHEVNTWESILQRISNFLNDDDE